MLFSLSYSLVGQWRTGGKKIELEWEEGESEKGMWRMECAAVEVVCNCLNVDFEMRMWILTQFFEDFKIVQTFKLEKDKHEGHRMRRYSKVKTKVSLNVSLNHLNASFWKKFWKLPPFSSVVQNPAENKIKIFEMLKNFKLLRMILYSSKPSCLWSKTVQNFSKLFKNW
jgi:hypothetical protein